jgi:hypothetical protein
MVQGCLAVLESSIGQHSTCGSRCFILVVGDFELLCGPGELTDIGSKNYEAVCLTEGLLGSSTLSPPP